ncbi:MAG: hypothetical protein Q9223_004348 [Gallowayella weberi]
MCFCGPSHGKSRDLPPSNVVHSPDPKEVDDLSQSLRSLSLQSKPIPSVVSAPSVITLPSGTTSSVVTTSSLNTAPSTFSAPPTTRHPVPIFPLAAAPECRHCGSIPESPHTVALKNANGNKGRSYYICHDCKSRKPREGWITWDDGRGIDPTIGPCFCPGGGFACRKDKMGAGSVDPGRGFWTCAVGGCGFTSWRRDGRTNEQALRLGLGYDEGWYED